MSKARPIPPVEGMTRVERGVGPVAKQPAEQAAADGVEPDQEQPEAAPAVPTSAAPAGPVERVPGQHLAAVVEVPNPAAAPPAGAGQPGEGLPFGPAAAGWTRQDNGVQERPRAVDLCGPREKVEREQVSAHVPRPLRLKRRLTLYALDLEMDVQDVIAVALDQWLAAQNA